jgi:CarD family transcriptional regulator
MPSSKTAKKTKTVKKAKTKGVTKAKSVARTAKKAKTITKAKEKPADFTIGDYVVYPMHGVGQICSIKREEILGEKKPCYIFEIASSKMKVTIPTEKAKQIGIRPIIGKREVKKVLDLLQKEEVDTEEDWKIRYQNNMNKIKSGSIYSVAEVCRDLYKRARDKELSLMERRLYESAYSLISSEIALTRQVSQEEAGNLISEVLSAS